MTEVLFVFLNSGETHGKRQEDLLAAWIEHSTSGPLAGKLLIEQLSRSQVPERESQFYREIASKVSGACSRRYYGRSEGRRTGASRIQASGQVLLWE
jgi:predicted transposase YdaD